MFKSKYLLFLVMTLIMIMGTFNIPTAHAAYNLIWSDEFDGSSVNTNNWTFETGGGGWGNNELEYYTAGNNTTVSGGILTITAKKENMGGYAYTSTRMITKGKHEFTYGKIEARIQVPKGQGMWPAFWMLGSNISNVNWPTCGEIDIMEHINSDDVNHMTMHWNNNGHVSYGGTYGVNNISAWHIYDITWDTNAITWHIDGIQVWQGNIANNINNTGAFHLPFFILLNLAVGGNWPGNPDGTTVFPAQMLVDYVRVYADTGNNTPTPTATKTATATKTPTPTPTASSGYRAWAAGVAYKIGDIVSYGGKNYKCIQAHTSLVGWEPPNVPALWQAI